MLPIAESYGPVLQGEGPMAGRSCWFIRFGGCNLSCSWCDSAYTWDSSRYDLRQEITKMPPEQVLADMGTSTADVILTGGEPLMHQKNPAWDRLLRGLFKRGISIAVETNGTIAPSATTQTYVSHYSISPKLGNAGLHKSSQNPRLADWPHDAKRSRSILKFVVSNAEEVAEAADVAVELGWTPDRVWVMPEGITKDEVLENWAEIFDAAANLGINATQRLHVLAFDNKRGV